MLPGVLSAPSSEKDGCRRRPFGLFSFPGEHTTLDLNVDFKCNQVIKKRN